MRTIIALAAVAVLLVGCSTQQPTGILTVHGLQLDWNLDEMVRRSDAVVVGQISEALGTTTIDGPAPPGEDARYDEEFHNYKLTVETSYHPASLPESIAVMTGPYPVSDDANLLVEHDQIPGFAVNDRVLVFLDSLDDLAYADGPTDTAPTGYTKATWYRVITGSRFSKLTERGSRWEDTRSFETVSVEAIREAVMDEKSGP